MMFGAKLNYIKGLKGQCPSGYEIKYYREGGRVCAKCEAIQKQAQTFQNPIDAFKCGRKMKKKSCGGKVKEAKCGSKVEMDKCGKKMKKKQEGGELEARRKGVAESNRANMERIMAEKERIGNDYRSNVNREYNPAFSPRMGSTTNPIALPEITVTPNGTYPTNPLGRYTRPNYRPTWKR